MFGKPLPHRGLASNLSHMFDASSQPIRIAPSIRAAAAATSWRSTDRWLTLMAFVLSLGVLLTAAWLQPSSDGTGTHQQLGLPPCGVLTLTGMPCVSCGMTTAFSHAASGDPVAALLTQPAGALLAVLAAMCVLLTGYSLIHGVSLEPLVTRLMTLRTVFAFGAVLILAWVYKCLSVSGIV